MYLVLFLAIVATPQLVNGSENIVYSVYKELDLGRPGETPRKDYYVSMGSAQGVHIGSILTVSRRMATYDLISEKLYKEVIFPIAKIKVIHAERSVAIGRLQKMLPPEETPTISPLAIMVGDLVSAGD